MDLFFYKALVYNLFVPKKIVKYRKNYKNTYIDLSLQKRIYFIFSFLVFIFFILIIKLFQVQVLSHGKYSEIAHKKHWGEVITPASRGEVLVRDIGNTFYSLATNETLALVYVDPSQVEDKAAVAGKLAEMLFEDACVANLKTKSRFCEKEIEDDKESFISFLKIPTVKREDPPKKKEEDNNNKKPEEEREPTIQEKKEIFAQEIFKEISKQYRERILLMYDPPQEIIDEIPKWGIMGLEANKDYLYAYPLKVKNPDLAASKLRPFLEMGITEIKKLLSPSLNKYVPIVEKLDLDKANEIKKMKLKGVRIIKEEFRVYPEGRLASQSLGFIDSTKKARYGIEERYNSELRGEDGVVAGEKDPLGRQSSSGKTEVKPVKHGDDVILTIDRVIQYEIEKKIEYATKIYKADAGQIIVMEPFSGEIIAVASYPTFDPNVFTKVFKKQEVSKETVDERQAKWQDFPYIKEKENFFIYENIYGSGVYKNPCFTDLYEPGSVFKVLTMAAAVDAGEVEPGSTYFDYGPIEVDMGKWRDKHYIKNSDNTYRRTMTMIDILKWSSNTGISYVAKKLGRELFYNYIKNLGFADFTNVDYSGEESGKIKYFQEWSEVELYTYGFGQGFSATPIQVITEVSSIANGGFLMQPRLVHGFRSPEGKLKIKKPIIVRKIFSKETSEKLKMMMVLAVRDGVADAAQVPGYKIAGKTGTSQTYRYGRALSGGGTTITTFVGFAPMNNPKFVVLIKLDRPKTSEWGSKTAAPVFKGVASFLLDYYKIPPSN